jgi:hypothetical protein
MQGHIDVAVYIFVLVSICTTKKALDNFRSDHLLYITLIPVNANSFKKFTIMSTNVCYNFIRFFLPAI